jgi:etoposide-induced 2.4 mRNA
MKKILININLYMLNIFLFGIWDSLKIWYPLHLLVRSSTIRKIFSIAFFINALVFVVNLYYFVYISSWYPNFWQYFTIIFLILWEIPCFVITIFINYYYGNQLMELVYKKKYTTITRSTKQIASELVYGRILIYSTHLLLFLVNLTIRWTFVTTIVSYIGYSWLTAYYLFEPRLVYKGYTLKQRISFFEHRWLYFLGYGSICAICYLIYPYRIMYSLYYSVTNLLILNTVNLIPLKYDKLESIPIFGITGSFTDYILLQLTPKIE